MKTVTTIIEVRDVVKRWHKEGMSVAFAPTMGNLHRGHIKLVNEAKKQADKVVVSIFVNPTQFGVGEDFTIYPRTVREDKEKLVAADTDLLFLPGTEEIYPDNGNTVVSVSYLSKQYCGASRPGHFDGVATVVIKLFNIVQPDIVFFGEKDFQQLVLIRCLLHDLNMPIELVGVATERELDGLAMSSRNVFLTEHNRGIAPSLNKALIKAKQEILTGSLSFDAVEQEQKAYLENLGFEIDYFSICNALDLQMAVETDRDLVILVAAKLGKPRLIDNIYFSRAHA